MHGWLYVLLSLVQRHTPQNMGTFAKFCYTKVCLSTISYILNKARHAKVMHIVVQRRGLGMHVQQY